MLSGFRIISISVLVSGTSRLVLLFALGCIVILLFKSVPTWRRDNSSLRLMAVSGADSMAGHKISFLQRRAAS